MKSLVTLLTLLSLLGATAVQAEERCAVAMTLWQPREAVAKLAADNGWTLRRIRIDDGCYLVQGTDAQGKKFAVKLHPATLAIVEQGHGESESAEYEKPHHD
ncbi:MAG: PepSY domain-containing protein [Cypionkella sp.]